ncbi:AAA family ATPase [Cyanobacterium stanieri LEGE 03274]|uniref:Nuclease SbcCD subunit C n=1 Tax=Cyanobacterium stanieri LEGE 03274 TaxID=1828756 RepID=A0ABR9V5H7_9CHRO|nr:AAA family ATPase [Cyanobacterium stanieri]MBE9222396.1 AAA family ATPase [Cyanobacterium stanieri LEGE 03274]
MIPKKLILQNFLSYRQATLDFDGLHTACICGANGAGKSSLLEAITWAIWGKTRAKGSEDVIHLGEKNTRVDFEFSYGGQVYRVIRTKQRKGSSTLDFQIFSHDNFNSISAKGINETQERINDCLKIDYDTFVNSAYLQQGQADKFMTYAAAQRKEILVKLLKLDEYDKIADRAKEMAKGYTEEKNRLQGQWDLLENKLEEKESHLFALDNVNQDLVYHQNEHNNAEKSLKEFQVLGTQRDTVEKELIWQNNQLLEIRSNLDKLVEDKRLLLEEMESLRDRMGKEDEIINNYQYWEKCLAEDTILTEKLKEYKRLISERNNLEETLRQGINDLEQNISNVNFRLGQLEDDKLEKEKIVANKDDVINDLAQFKYYHDKFVQLDLVKNDFYYLQQQESSLIKELEKEEAKLSAKVEQLEKQEYPLQEKLQQIPEVRKQYFDVSQELDSIGKQRNYLTRIEEKKANQLADKKRFLGYKNDIHQQIEEINQKLNTLRADNDAVCPVCESPLDDAHLRHVIDSGLKELKNLENSYWQYDSDIIKCDRTLAELNKEYQDLQRQLSKEEGLQKECARLENYLNSMDDVYEQLEEISTQKNNLILLIDAQNYLPDINQELSEVKEKIKALNYSEETYSLVKENEYKYRWAESNHQKLLDAEQKISTIEQDINKYTTELSSFTKQLEDLKNNSNIQQNIEDVNQKILKINYTEEYHEQVRKKIQELQNYQFEYSKLEDAKKRIPSLENKISEYQEKIVKYNQEIQEKEANINDLKQKLSTLVDYKEEINKLQQQVNLTRTKINEFLSKKGSIEQSLDNIKKDEKQLKYIQKELKDIEKNYRIYAELQKAFGKNGIQALMIENLLPQLEAEANQILSRLTNNQLHIQFITQKEKTTKSKKSKSNFKDTLDIIISDAQGTRSYETYSGGESFRINFSIRLALSRILTQRSGTALQLLIIDEGFGTQDDTGCNLLIGALNKIADDFACILTVTHMPQFKEAFQSRIEVYKTDNGSQISLSV